MSYKDYSTEAVKTILQNTRNGYQPDTTTGFARSSALSIDELIEIGAEIGLKPEEVRNAAKVYDHPEIPDGEKSNETHILIEKKFSSSIPVQLLWEKIKTELKNRYSDELPQRARIYPEQYQWSYVNEDHHETVVSLQKNYDLKQFKISQRLSYRSPQVEGMILSTYLSILFSVLIYAIFEPQAQLMIAIVTFLWAIQCGIFFRVSIRSRTKKIQELEKFADQVVDRITFYKKKDL